MKSSPLLTLSFLLLVSSIALMAQERTASALPHAGPNRPAAVPADYVITPFGYFHPSCVLQLNKGESLRDGGILRHADGSTEQVAPCEHPHYKPSGEIATGSLDEHTTAAVQPLDTAPPPAINGWVEDSNAAIGTAFGKEVSTWTVPPLPMAQDGQTIFFFPGLETLASQTDILQPVLGSTNGGQWNFVSWNCCPSNIVVHSSGINVSPGDKLVGTSVMTCAAGTTSCSTWNVISEDQTTNQSTELSNTPPLTAGQAFNWGFGGVLEAYNVVQCPDYPADAALTITSTMYDTNLNLVPSLNWSLATPSSATQPQCEYAVKTAATSANATNTTLTYGATGPGFQLTFPAGGISVNRAGSTTQTIEITDFNGFTGAVSFAAQNLPPGVSAKFAPGSSSNTHTLTLSATNTVPLTGNGQPLVVTIVGTASGVPAQTYLLNIYVNPQLTGGLGSSVDLSGAYDVYAFYDDGDQPGLAPAESLDTAGNVYSANLLSPPGKTPMGLNLNGTQFTFGPPNELDSVYGTGANPIDLPGGKFASLNVLATGVNGAQESQAVIVTYTDGSTQDFTQTFDDWSSGASCTSSHPCAAGESVAVTMPYRDTPGGEDGSVFYLFAYSFPLNSGKTVKSMTLPENRNVVVLAATMTAGAYYTIGGAVSGLSGKGLVLRNNSGNNLAVGANGTFKFSTPIAIGGSYDVTVFTQPSSPTQTCAVTGGSGKATANVTSVRVVCTDTYTIGGTVSGLSGKGLVLRDNGGNNLAVGANGRFKFTTAIDSGGAYDVTVFAEPSSPAQTCAVTDGSGKATANVTAIRVD